MSKKYFVIFGLFLATGFLFLNISTVKAATITSTATGAWTATTTWVGGVVPFATDSVVIDTNHTVTLGTSTTTVALTLNSGAILDGAGFNLTLSGSGTPLTKSSGNGVFKNIPTVTYSSASATNIATGTYANLTISGAATKTLLANTTATSTLTLSTAGDILDGAGFTLTLSG
ncbi:MAG: hypothetical protein ABIJ19_00430, partial [Patescibacteria group bacterium]